MDWNQDGKLDILSGCYWTDDAPGAHLQILRGKGDLNFAKAKPLTGISGQPLQNVEVPEGAQAETKAICTEQHAVDYDGDGDLDLVVGCFGPEFFYYENEAEAGGKNAIVDKPIELPIKSTGHHSSPHLVDWDNDGDLDLLSGSDQGGVLLSVNTGTREEPVWSPFQELVAPSGKREQSSLDGEFQMGVSTRVWATDWNGDGQLDLLVGDQVTLSQPADGINQEEWKSRRKEDEAKMTKLSEEMSGFQLELQELAEAGKEPEGELAEQLQEYSKKMNEIYNARSEYDASKTTGHVWLLIRKPTTEMQLSMHGDLLR